MVGTFSKEKRSRNMSLINMKVTKPEILFRAMHINHDFWFNKFEVTMYRDFE